MLLILRGFVAVWCCSFGASLVASAEHVPIVRNVCEIAQRPLAFDGHRIAISATLIHNGVDVLHLADDHCADVAIDIRFASDRRHSAELDRLMDALNNSGMRGNPFFAISGTFVGVVRVSPEGASRQLRLFVESVEDVSISPETE